MLGLHQVGATLQGHQHLFTEALHPCMKVHCQLIRHSHIWVGSIQGVEAEVDEEGRVAGGRVDPVVVRKLGDGEPVHPVVLVVVDVQSEVLFQLLVDPLRLSVGLGVVRRGRVVLDAQEAVKVDREP